MGPVGVSIGNPAAASTLLLASIVAWASMSTRALSTCCGVGRSRSIVVKNESPLHEFRYTKPAQLSMRDERKVFDA